MSKLTLLELRRDELRRSRVKLTQLDAWSETDEGLHVPPVVYGVILAERDRLRERIMELEKVVEVTEHAKNQG